MKYFFAFIAICFLALFATSGVRASSLYLLSDTVSRHAPGIPSDHTIKFKTPHAFDAAGQSFTISFPAGFTLGALTASDFLLSTGPGTGLESTLSLSSTPSIASWGVAVFGQNIIFTHPTSSAVDINADEYIVVRIGTVAGGAHQIINRVTEGSATITISTSEGATGRLAIPIAQDQVGVSGDVGGIAAVVLLPPASVTRNSMTLIWTQSADPNFYRYRLYYSTTPGVSALSPIAATVTSVANTTATITGLNPATQYYFAVLVESQTGLVALSNEVSDQTLSSSSGVTLPAPNILLDIAWEECPVFQTPWLTRGTRSPDVQLVINNDSNNFIYPTATTWQKMLAYILGPNQFSVYGIYPNNQISTSEVYTLYRYTIGDVNGDAGINDFDLSGLAWHWAQDWCKADFNNDDVVNDFDLAGLASHWGR